MNLKEILSIKLEIVKKAKEKFDESQFIIKKEELEIVKGLL